MNHKKKKQKNARAGCKMCKPWKSNGYHIENIESEKFSDHRRRLIAKSAIKELDIAG